MKLSKWMTLLYSLINVAKLLNQRKQANFVVESTKRATPFLSKQINVCSAKLIFNLTLQMLYVDLAQQTERSYIHSMKHQTSFQKLIIS